VASGTNRILGTKDVAVEMFLLEPVSSPPVA
jgi:hypothetical protein